MCFKGLILSMVVNKFLIGLLLDIPSYDNVIMQPSYSGSIKALAEIFTA